MMKKTLTSLLVVSLLALAAILAQPTRPQLVPSAQAATPNVAISNPGVMLIPLHISGQYTTTTTSAARFNMPMACDMLGVGASARASTTTMNVDVKSAGTTILSAPIAVIGSTYTEATIATSAIADEALITVDLNFPFGAGTAFDSVVFMTCVRK